jgi:hypothetical protein
MLRTSGVLLAIFGILVPAASTSTLAEPKLTLKAPRMNFVRPRMPNQRTRPTVTVRITARLEDLDEAEDLEEYYCLEEVWDWDDDTESEYAPDCEPYEEGAEIKQHFSATHQYRYPGNYRVYLRLERNGKTVIAGSARVQIRS